MTNSPTASERDVVAKNRAARHDYEILEQFEAGLVLTGTEVKSIRDGRVNLGDAYGVVRNGELWLVNAHISQYGSGGYVNHEPTRTRKLLLHRREIRRLIGSLERQGLPLVPLEMYFLRGRAKVRHALARGKKLHDKRDDARRPEAEREMSRAFRRR
jgi:SsrA-binding protein